MHHNTYIKLGSTGLPFHVDTKFPMEHYLQGPSRHSSTPSPLLSLFVSFLIILSTAAQSATSPGDQQALLSFKSLLGANNALSSWNNTVHFCRWSGVTCGKLHQDRVTALQLDALDLTGTISPSLANLTFLISLNLSSNKLYGQIPPELGLLPRLKELYLDINELEGEIPETLGLLSSLEVLFLSNNKLRGKIPSSLGNCSALNSLILDNNNLTGSIPSSLGNLSVLAGIDLGFNNLSGGIPDELGNLKDLQHLSLLFNQISGNIPPNIYNLSSLYNLLLGSNLLTGSLPVDFGRYLSSLLYLYMYDNNLEGPIPSSIVNASNLVGIEIGTNRFVGQVPPNLGLISSLEKLNLDGNLLETKKTSDWDFLTSLSNCTNLEELDLSYNNFSEPLPDSLGNLPVKLQWLRLRGNQITGGIPVGIGNLRGLVNLDIEYNRLTGVIPDTVGKLVNLDALTFRGNMLSGEIPSSLGSLTKLSELYLSKNNLSGSIPTSFASLQKLGVFDIAHNNLTGVIPRGVISISSLSTFLNLSHNNFVGNLHDDVAKLINLKALDVSYNQLSGKIPSGLRNCLLLEFLNLLGNSFSESIPEGLSELKGLQILDLSQNQLSGPIPKSLETLTSVQFLNLSYNNLEGEVPIGGIFSNASSFSVVGNKDLCGGQPTLNLRACSKKESALSAKAIAIICVAAAVGFLLLLLLLLLVVHKYRGAKVMKMPKNTANSRGNQFLKISYADLKYATNDFSPSNLVGTGGFGSVYKGFLKQENKTVAVKVLDQRLHAASKSFMAECNVLRNVRHRNLVSILTSCSSVDSSGNDFEALVYEFMPNGNLQMWLHWDAPSRTSTSITVCRLNARQRLDIAIDIASALDYLHNHTETPIVHRDLKPSNVLLDNDLTAHVTDFGIAKFLSVGGEPESSLAEIKGSIGYMAPEAGMWRTASTMLDVYSFGILLLEMFTGKKPTDESLADGLDLHNHVKRSFPENIQDILDPEILSDERNGVMDNRTRECLISVIGIALICSNGTPRERMEIHEVLKQLDEVKRTLHVYEAHERKLN